MKANRNPLRERFQAETDVEIDPQPEDWRRYALWLEKLSLKELNNELIRENELLRSRMRKAMDTLEAGITGRYAKHKKRQIRPLTKEEVSWTK